MMLIFGCALRRVHSPSSGLGEIKDTETGKNLLEDKVRLLCVKMDEVRVEIGDKGFRIAAAGLRTDNAEGYFVEIWAV